MTENKLIDLNNKYNDLKSKYKNQYEFINLNPSSKLNTSQPKGCVIQENEDSSDFPVTMKLIDNNLHTQESCRLAASMEFADVKYNEKMQMIKRKINKKRGLSYKIVDGYFADNSAYFLDKPSLSSEGRAIDFSTIQSSTSGSNFSELINKNNGNNLSVEWFGYIYATETGNWGFSLSSDDGSYLWLGNNAINDYSISSSFINNGGTHSTVTKTKTKYLVKNTYYPIRIQYGQKYGNYNFGFTISPPSNPSKTNAYDVLYAFYNNDDSLYEMKQLYYSMVESSPENTKNNLFNCYITDPNDANTNNILKKYNNPNNEGGYYNNVEYKIGWNAFNDKTDDTLIKPDNYAMVDELGNFNIYNSNNTVIKSLFANSPYNCDTVLDKNTGIQYKSKYNISLTENFENIKNTIEGFFGFSRKKKRSPPQIQQVAAPLQVAAPQEIAETQEIAVSTPPATSLNQSSLSQSIIAPPPVAIPPPPIINQPPPQPPPQPIVYKSNEDKINDHWRNTGCKLGYHPIKSYRLVIESNGIQGLVVLESTGPGVEWNPVSVLIEVDINGSVPNNKWKKDIEKNNIKHTIEKNVKITNSTYIISKDARCKLHINKNGNLQFVFCKSACGNLKQNPDKSTFIYSNDKNNRYLYNLYVDPHMNKRFYVNNSSDTSEMIPNNSSILSYDTKYSQYNNYVPSSDVIKSSVTVNKKGECEQKCNTDNNCSHYYFYKTSDNKSQCNLGTNASKNIVASNLFNIRQPQSNIKESNLYIRNKSVNLSKEYMREPIPMKNIQSYQNYNNTTLLSSEFNSPHTVGIISEKDVQAIYKKQSEYLHGKEGFAILYNNNDVDCVNDFQGCISNIENKKQQSLAEKVNGYANSTTQLNKNKNNLSTNIQSYNSTYQTLNNDPKYNFNPKHNSILEKKPTIMDGAQEDLNELIMNENNNYILGSIATATLLIVAVMIGSE